MLYLETAVRPLVNWEVCCDADTARVLNSNPQQLLQRIFADDPNNVFLLENTGFNMSIQLQTWMNLYSEAIKKNGNLAEVTKQLISKTTEDVIGFYFEYLSQQDIFPIRVEFVETEDGRKTVYASRYNQTLESLALPTERDGALAEGVKKVVEILTSSDPRTVVFLTSPKGESGLGYDYPDSQTYVYWINPEGHLEAITVRADIDLDSNERLAGIEAGANVSTWERLKRVVSSPRSIRADGFEAVLNLMEEASGQRFDKQRNEIRNREKLFTLNEEALAIIENLKKYLEENISHLNEDSIKLFVVCVGRSILDLAKLTLQQEQEGKIVYTTANHYPTGMGISYQDYYTGYRLIYEQVQAIPGCNGGGDVGTSPMLHSFGFVQMQLEGGKEKCQKCGTTENVACGWCSPCWEKFGRS